MFCAMKGSAMFLSRQRWSFLCSVLAVAAACSSTTEPAVISTPGPDGSTPLPDVAAPDPDPDSGVTADVDIDAGVDEMCGEYARLECGRNRDCFVAFLDWTYGSYDACLAESKQSCAVWSSLAGTSLTVAKLLSCSRAYAAAGCDAQGPLAECQFAPGALSNGGGCLLNDQCASGHCRREGANECGACADKLPEGAACARATECQSGRCSGGLCEPILKEGEACTLSSDCLRNLICNEGSCQKIVLVGEGQACGGATLCEAYMSCANGTCAKDVAVDIGQRCGRLDNGTFALCRLGDCDPVSVCVNRQPAGAGCSETRTCAGTGACNDGICQPLSTEVCDVPPRQVPPHVLLDRVALPARP
jgi:hypothetical protein